MDIIWNPHIRPSIVALAVPVDVTNKFYCVNTVIQAIVLGKWSSVVTRILLIGLKTTIVSVQ